MKQIIKSLVIYMTLLILISCAVIDDKNKKGVGLTRNSFGELNPNKIKPGLSLCNSNLGMGLDEKLSGFIGGLIDPVRNSTGNDDKTLAKEELEKYFSFRSVTGHEVVRIINRDDYSIDFWLTGDATREAYHADEAASDYCKSRDNKISKYVGFSYKCGKDIEGPVVFNGKRVSAKEEELIVAYDCVEQKSKIVDNKKNVEATHRKSRKKTNQDDK